MSEINAIYNANVYLNGNNLMGQAAEFKMPEIESSLEKTILKLWLAHPIDVTPGLSKIEKDIYNLFDNDMINLTAKKINELLPIYSYSQVNRSLKK